MKKLLLLLALATALLAPRAQAQSVGIGTAAPSAKVALDVQSPTNNTGLLVPRLTAGQRTGIAAPPQGLLVYQTDGTAGGGPQTGFWYFAGTGGWAFLNAAGLALPYSGTTATAAPTAAFAVANTSTGAGLSGTAASTSAANPAVLGNNTNATGAVSTGVLGLTTAGYAVRGVAFGSGGYGVTGEATDALGVAGIATSGIGVSGVANSNDLDQGAVDGFNNNTGAAAVGVRGETAGGGVGVRGVGTTGTGVAGETTSGFGVQAISGTGTALGASSTSGRALAAATASSGSAVLITQTGTGLALDAVGGAMRAPAVRSAATGTANLLPICYGNIDGAGSIFAVGSTANFTVSKAGVGIYDITITGVAYFYQNFSTVAALSGGSGGSGEILTNSISGTNLRVFTFDSAGTPADRAFNFVTYKP